MYCMSRCFTEIMLKVDRNGVLDDDGIVCVSNFNRITITREDTDMLPLNFVLCTFKNRKKHFFVTHTFISRFKNKLKLKKKRNASNQ